MGEELFCKPAKDLKSFADIGLPAEYDELFFLGNTTMEEYIAKWRFACYTFEYDPTYHNDISNMDNIRAEADILEALCKHRYIRAEFGPIYNRLLRGLYSESMANLGNNIFLAFLTFVRKNYELFSPNAYFRTNMIEDALRQALPGMQYDLMAKLGWPDDLESAKEALGGRIVKPSLFEFAILEKAFENIEKTFTIEFFIDIFEKAIVF